MTTRDPPNPEQEKVNRGRRRKTYQTREENKRDDPKRDRTTKTTKSSLGRQLIVPKKSVCIGPGRKPRE